MTGEKRRTIRMADEIWIPFSEKARSEGRDASEVLRSKAVEYLGESAQPRSFSDQFAPVATAIVGVALALNVPIDDLDEVIAEMRPYEIPHTAAAIVEQVRKAASAVSERKA